MPLDDLTLWGNYDKVEVAIERLRRFEPDDGYYLAYSGGKDSTVILELARMAGVQFEAHHNLTTADPPEVVRFVKGQPEIIIDRPEETMWQLIVRKGIPPTRRIRYCCKKLKEHGGAGRTVITGVRWAESSRRKKTREVIEGCNRYDRMVVNPIIDWTDYEAWEFIKQRRLSYCSLYDEGFKRTGCILCPMGRRKQRLRQADRWPKYYQQYLRTFTRMLKRRRMLGREPFYRATPQTAQGVMDWWLSDQARVSKEQMLLFDQGER